MPVLKMTLSSKELLSFLKMPVKLKGLDIADNQAVSDKREGFSVS